MSMPHAGVLVSLTLSAFALHASSISLYVEGPTIQSSSVPGITTEAFDELSAGIYTTSVTTGVGTYMGTPSTPFAIINADQYGGTGGTGTYLAVGSETGAPGDVLLQLNSPQNYFGFWWSAGDAFNSITLLRNGSQLATFTTAQLITLLPRSGGTTVTAINGTQYNTIDYWGNPNSGQNFGEPYAYVDLIAAGAVFNQVLISNPGNTGFESDNHSIALGVTDPPIGDVIVSTVPGTVPEPSTSAFAILGLSALFLGRAKVTHRV